jgi:hypothetical protein
VKRFIIYSLTFYLGFSGIYANDTLRGRSYSDLFKQAKLHLAHNREKQAIPVLEELYKRDASNTNVQYLLGLSLVKSRAQIKRAINLLETAKEGYSKFYDRTSVTERGVSEYVYYYLIIAYSLRGECKMTIKTLNEFYKIYSYEDEWYLIEGQKWHRECGLRTLEEDSIVSAPDSALLTIAPDTTIASTAMTDTTVKTKAPKMQDTAQTVAQVESALQTPESRPIIEEAPSVKLERLQPVTAAASKPEYMSREVQHTAQVSLFGVQVSALLTPRYSKDFKDLKNVEVYIDKNGVFRYVVGRFVYRTQAEKLLEYVRAVGYGDAFIVDINSGEKYEEEVIRINNASIKREIKGEVDFRVQLGAFTEEIPDNILAIFMKFEGIEESIQGKLTLFTLGKFPTYDIAKVYCEEIKQQGVPDAFVVAFNEGNKIPLGEAQNYLINRYNRDKQEALRQEREQEKKTKKKKQ